MPHFNGIKYIYQIIVSDCFHANESGGNGKQTLSKNQKLSSSIAQDAIDLKSCSLSQGQPVSGFLNFLKVESSSSRLFANLLIDIF